jgi:hypothetical protein
MPEDNSLSIGAITYSVYSQLPSIAGDCLTPFRSLRTCHAVATRGPADVAYFRHTHYFVYICYKFVQGQSKFKFTAPIYVNIFIGRKSVIETGNSTY